MSWMRMPRRWRTRTRSRSESCSHSWVCTYLRVEKQWTGVQVQRTHMRLAQNRRAWPTIPLPSDRGSMTAADVMAKPAGEERDRAIDAWCRSVWSAFAESRGIVVGLLREYGYE